MRILLRFLTVYKNKHIRDKKPSVKKGAGREQDRINCIRVCQKQE